jgi:hypothetical protein
VTSVSIYAINVVFTHQALPYARLKQNYWKSSIVSAFLVLNRFGQVDIQIDNTGKFAADLVCRQDKQLALIVAQKPSRIIHVPCRIWLGGWTLRTDS